MRKLDANEWRQIIQGSDTARSIHLDGYREDVEIITNACDGRVFHGGGGDEESTHDIERQPRNNFMFRWFTRFLPEACMYPPMVDVDTDNGGGSDLVAKATRSFFPLWQKSADYLRLKRMACLDYGVRWCVGMVHVEKHPTITKSELPQSIQDNIGEGEVMMPVLSLLELEDFFVDPYSQPVKGGRGPRFAGHRWTMTKDELLAMAESDEKGDWDIESIEGMVTSSMPRDRMSGVDQSVSVDLEWVEGWTVWVRDDYDGEKDGDDQYNGRIITITDMAQAEVDGGDGDPEWGIIQDTPYFGPPEGPYVMGGHIWSKKPYPTSPLRAARPTIKDTERVKAQIHREAENFRSVVVVDGSQAHILDKVREAEHQGVAIVENFDPEFWDRIEEGGVTDAMARWDVYVTNECEEMLGLDASQSGVVDGRGTATQSTIADERAGARFAMMVKGMDEWDADVHDRVGWYFYNLDSIVAVSKPRSLGEDGNPQDATYVTGGLPDQLKSDGDRKPAWGDHDIIMRAGSSGRAARGGEQQRKLVAMDAISNQVIKLLQLGVNREGINELIDYMERTQDLPGLAAMFNGLVPPKALEMMYLLQAAGGARQGEGGQGGQSPSPPGGAAAGGAQQGAGQGFGSPQGGLPGNFGAGAPAL